MWPVRHRRLRQHRTPLGHATHRCLATVTGHDETLTALAFSPDGATLATASKDHTARLWGGVLWHSADDLHATVCAILVEGIPRADWEWCAPTSPYRRTCP
jgi:hypothetical protein